MPAIGAAVLSIDNASTQSTTRTLLDSVAVADNTDHLVVAIANYRINGTANETPTIEIECGGTIYTWGSENAINIGGAAPQALGAGQIAGAWLFTSGTSQTIGVYLRTSNGSGSTTAAHAHSVRIVAIELTEIPGPGTGSAQRRWHAETANNDTIVATPANGAGLVNVGDPLTFTPNTTGPHLIFGSAELVKNAATTALEQSFAITQDGTILSGTKHYKECDSQPNGDVAAVGALGYPVSLTSGVSTTFRIQGNGTNGAGEFGYRRIRLHALDLAAFTEALTDTDTTGATINGIGTVDTLVAMTVAGHATARYVMLGGVQKQCGTTSSYDDAGFNQSTEGTRRPTDGASRHINDGGVGNADDISLTSVLDSAVITASRTLTLRMNKRAGAGNNLYGNHCGRSADRGAMWGSVILLDAPSGGGTVEGEGSSAGSATASGNLVGTGALAGTVAGTSSESANLVGTGALAGASDGEASSSGNLVGSGALGGAAAGDADAAGALVGTGELEGTISGTGAATGAMSGTGALAGASAGVADADAALIGVASIAGAAAGAATSEGALRGIGGLAANDAGTATAVGNLAGTGALAGTAAGTATAVATAEQPAPIRPLGVTFGAKPNRKASITARNLRKATIT